MQFGSFLIMLKPPGKTFVDLKSWALVDQASSQTDTSRNVRRLRFRISVGRKQPETLGGSGFHCYRVNYTERVNILRVPGPRKTDNSGSDAESNTLAPNRILPFLQGQALAKPTMLSKGLRAGLMMLKFRTLRTSY